MSHEKQKVKLMNIIIAGVKKYESSTGGKIKSVNFSFEEATFEIQLKDKRIKIN